MRKRALLLSIFILAASLSGCGDKSADADAGNILYVYNWGEYIDPEILTMFTEETGIEVVYDEFETNEVMYPKIKAGAVNDDLV